MSAKAATRKVAKDTAKQGATGGAHKPASGRVTTTYAVMEEVRRAGLLDGDATEHISFRAPKALVEAAKRETGATKPTELCLLALAMLARPDPVAEYMKKTRGALGPDHTLDY
jgi:hypothetical protein